MQDTESAAACAGHFNQCILPFPFLPWTYLLPLPYPQHQACFQKIPRLLDKDTDPSPRNLHGQELVLAWHHRGENLETLGGTIRLKNCKMFIYQYVRVHTDMYAYILLHSLNYRYVPVHTSTYLFSHHIIWVLPHGLGQWSTSFVYTLVRNHAIVHHDVNRLVPCCTGAFQVYRILRDLENLGWCTGMNWYVHVLWRFKAVYSGILKISLRILYTWNGPVQDGTRRFTSSYTIAWFRTRVYTEDVLLFPMQWISPS